MTTKEIPLAVFRALTNGHSRQILDDGRTFGVISVCLISREQGRFCHRHVFAMLSEYSNGFSLRLSESIKLLGNEAHAFCIVQSGKDLSQTKIDSEGATFPITTTVMLRKPENELSLVEQVAIFQIKELVSANSTIAEQVTVREDFHDGVALHG